jgi:serine aminopeptidase S33 family
MPELDTRQHAGAALALLLACASARPVPGSVAAVRHESRNGRDVVDEIIALPTRGGGTQPYLLLANEGGGAPRAVALMFPGGAGNVHLPADIAQMRLGNNFLVRSRELFRDRDVAVAILDAPSDHPFGMDEAFRSSAEHAEDVAAVVKDLGRRFPGARVYLVGTSMGTISAAYAGRALGSAVSGVVLTSTVFEGRRYGDGLRDFDFGTLAAPLLFVHHGSDGCWRCPYATAARLGGSYPLVTVRGGSPARSDECEALSAHGYIGREPGTAAAIKAWMLGEKWPATVE